MRNSFGEFVPGERTDIPLWCERRDAGSSDVQEDDGLVLRKVVEWTIRWRSDIANHDIRLIYVVDEGVTYNTETITESDERRRFLTIQGVGGHG